MIGNVQNDSVSAVAWQSANQPSLLPLLYAAEQNHGWSEGTYAIAQALLSGIHLPAGPVVEIGCGGGQLLAKVQQDYPDSLVIGTDLHPLALSYADRAKPASVVLTQSALPNLPWQANQFALLIALDVFDQQGIELNEALAEAYRILCPGGVSMIRVSAHPSLYGAHDLAFQTGQRYTRDQLQQAMLQAGFVLQRLTYANTILALPVAALRLAQRWRLLPWQPSIYHQDSYQIASWFMNQEAKWLRYSDLPWGLSLCAVARKPLFRH